VDGCQRLTGWVRLMTPFVWPLHRANAAGMPPGSGDPDVKTRGIFRHASTDVPVHRRWFLA
jgi:hypothetical protein